YLKINKKLNFVKLMEIKHKPENDKRVSQDSNLGALKTMPVLDVFQRIKEEQIPEQDITARKYIHLPTGATVVTVEADDPENVFCIVFPTPVDNSSGVPHIVEHSVFCGSRDFPLKDPFKQFLVGTVGRFLNASTHLDHTRYPNSSSNEAEFKERVRFYLNTVLHPAMIETVFEQEGHHLHLTEKDGELTRQGVVYGEMKGYVMQMDWAFAMESLKAIHQSGVYAVESGGTPEEIEKLTYDEFKKFYREHYQLNKALIYVYGKLSEEKKLALLKELLEEEGDISKPVPPEPPSIPASPPLKGQEVKEVQYDPQTQDVEKQGAVTINWRLPRDFSARNLIFWDLMEALLVGDDTAPVRKALLESGLGTELIETGVVVYTDPPTFHIGLRGIKPGDAKKVEQLVLQVLKKVAEEGFDKDHLESVFNSYEFRRRERYNGSTPRGLLLISPIVDGWLRGEEPIEHLKWRDNFNEIKGKNVADQKEFKQAIKSCLLENSERVRVDFMPAPGLLAKKNEEEQRRLKELKESLSPQEIDEIIARTWNLIRLQRADDPPEAVAKLKFISIDDLPKKCNTIPQEEQEIEGQVVYYQPLNTSGIVYPRVSYDISNLTPEELPYLYLYTKFLNQLGAGNLSWEELIKEMGKNTGGVQASTYFDLAPETRKLAARVEISGSALSSKGSELVDIFQRIIESPNWQDKDRIAVLLTENVDSFYRWLRSNPLSFAERRLPAPFSPNAALAESVFGVNQFLFLKKILERDDAVEHLSEMLSKIHSKITSHSPAVISLTADEQSYKDFSSQLARLAKLLPSADGVNSASVLSVPNFSPENEAIYQDMGVCFGGCAGFIQDNPLGIKGEVFGKPAYMYLWDKVRVEGGAYGSYLYFNYPSSVVSMLSWQDPNIARTLKIFKTVADYLEKISQDDLRKAIVTTVGRMDWVDHPKLEGDKAFRRRLLGITDEMRQRWRESLFNTTLEDAKTFAELLRKTKFRTVLVGPQSVLKDVEGVDGKKLVELSV
ncbi:MAG: hypothetical protein D6780_05895, partial [Candidatus Dadabacteria bacterium]